MFTTHDPENWMVGPTSYAFGAKNIGELFPRGNTCTMNLYEMEAMLLHVPQIVGTVES